MNVDLLGRNPFDADLSKCWNGELVRIRTSTLNCQRC